MSRLLLISTLALTASGVLTGAARTLPHVAQKREPPLHRSRQVLVVLTEDWNAVAGTLQRFERDTDEGPWTAIGASAPVVVGRSGLAWGRGVADDAASGGPGKKEGDGKAPAGVFRLGTSFGQSRQPLPGVALRYRSLDGNVECVDDVRSEHYNKLVTRQEVGRVDWRSSERMWTEPLYEWGIVVEHNAPAVTAGAGSCIFLHVWRRAGRGTAGCTAMDGQHLTQMIKWLKPASRPLLVQLPRAEYERLKDAWDLPDLG